ncbi:hypothetical protein BGZ70_002111 [Mortierella alpina]|uniref:Uncharacterized protein n=1 Tax=Mortierella alpina TaxID=64518 RepID=A0A9P6M762_MORAP|nr:hypothetical protein BGZ70_002111 [Mortierella alpina]
MKFQSTHLFSAALLVIMSLSAVNALPLDAQDEIAAVETADLSNHSESTFEIPADAKVEDSSSNGKKLTGCGFRSFFTYHSCL